MVQTDSISSSSPVPQSNPPEAFELARYLKQQSQLVEAALDKSLPMAYPETVYESMRYSLMAGGKRLRPVLCLATCELVGGTAATAMPTACALEMIHTMSLIHDDLPAMDDDDYRRGQLSNHKKFGEAVAILAGDALLSYAFEYIASQTQGAKPENVLRVISRLGKAVGAEGLVGGQIVDLASEGMDDISLETLTYIHTHKTAALLDASVTCGAILADAPGEDVEKLSRYAQNIGLAFQIVDDILDITSTAEELGKSVGKDVQAQKATYPSLWGLEKSKQQAQQLVDQAKQELGGFNNNRSRPLVALADYIVSRTH